MGKEDAYQPTSPLVSPEGNVYPPIDHLLEQMNEPPEIKNILQQHADLLSVIRFNTVAWFAFRDYIELYVVGKEVEEYENRLAEEQDKVDTQQANVIPQIKYEQALEKQRTLQEKIADNRELPGYSTIDRQVSFLRESLSSEWERWYKAHTDDREDYGTLLFSDNAIQTLSIYAGHVMKEAEQHID